MHEHPRLAPKITGKSGGRNDYDAAANAPSK